MTEEEETEEKMIVACLILHIIFWVALAAGAVFSHWPMLVAASVGLGVTIAMFCLLE